MNDYFSDCFSGGDQPSPYPVYPRMGALRRDVNPLTLGNEEFHPQAYETIGLTHDAPWVNGTQAVELQYASSQPADHRVEGQTLNPGRTQTNPGRFIAPQLLFSTMARMAFGRPAEIADSCPDPSIQRSYGQFTASPHDVVHTIPKQLLDYDYQALNQQDIADRARLSLRKAMYGK
jgi:hypothetical protein